VERLPQSLKNVINQLSSLPGVGPKSALRMGMILLKWPEDRVRNLGQSLIDLRSSLCLCSQCGGLTEQDPCVICSDPARRDDLLCVVADWDSMLTIDEIGIYRGKYFVLGGLLSPLEGVQTSQLDLNRLKQRIEEGNVSEIILALGTTRDSEATESYLVNTLEKEFPNIQLTRLAQGIPIGSMLKYVDNETIKQSLAFRQDLLGDYRNG